MIRLIPDSLGGRVIALLLGGLTVFHILSLWIYQNGVATLVGAAREQHLADRLVVIRRTIASLPGSERDGAAHALSGSGFDVHWTPASMLTQPAGDEDAFAALRARVRSNLPDIADTQLRVGYLDEGVPGGHHAAHVLLISVQLKDETWLNVATARVGPLALFERSVLMSTTAMGVGVLLAAVLLARSLTAPLQTLARAAGRLGVAHPAPPVPETGPREVRIAARAFNQMQQRIRRLIDDRTQTLAAVSHDLKTPITRLRLRAEFVSDPDTNRKILGDLDEMERMLDATLAFLRDEVSQEPAKVTDLAAMLQTICNDEADAGHDVSYDGPSQAALLCRGPALKRAIANIVGNAVKYGGGARVTLADGAGMLTVRVDDSGPGIPAEDIERVFEPFVRLEASRNAATGGYGLGLTFARTVARAHGGDVLLTNRPEGGLSATITLPRNGLAAPPQ
jgi:signal transduction histidine kinase